MLIALLYTLLALTSLFLICLVLIQRGKGGGLAGAFGGAGGSSAFGTKAGDVFTRVTMIAAGVWIALNMLLVVISNNRTSAWTSGPAASGKSDFTPSAKGDLDKLDKGKAAGESVEKGPGLPDALPKSPTAEPAIPASGESSPLLPKDLPKAKP